MTKKKENLQRLFNPKNIAVIGATNKAGHVGYSLMANLLENGLEAKVYPVNPYRQEIFGRKVYPTINDIPEKIDLALVAVPAPIVPKVMEECGQAQAAGVVIVSAGFKESGKKGKKLYKKLEKIVQKYPTRVVGPNCLGYLRPGLKINASFALQKAKKGRVAFVSQSGALGASIFDWAIQKNVGFSYFISIGEMIDVGFSNLLAYLEKDKETTSVILYLETVRNPQKFLVAARNFSLKKPIVVLKAGKSEPGARAALSHTGSLVGDNLVFEAVFKRVGALRVDTLEELFDNTRTLAMQPLPQGNRLAIVTNAGGPAVIATDILVEHGGVLAKISPQTKQKLKQALPPAANIDNPIDILGDADSQRFKLAVKHCLDDPQVDGVLTILAPQAMTKPTQVAEQIASLPQIGKKTTLASWMGGEEIAQGIDTLQKANIPAYQYPERAVKTFINLYNYSQNQRLLREKPPVVFDHFSPRKQTAEKVVTSALKSGRTLLDQEEANEVLKSYKLPVPPSFLTESRSEAKKIAKKIGYPVAVKISSPQVLHKTEFKGVKLNITSSKELEAAYETVIGNFKKKLPDAEPRGVLIEKMIQKEYELFLGSKRDPLFGPVVLFGRGGIAVEVFKDISADITPLNKLSIKRLIESTRIYTLLKGYRGMSSIDLEQLQFIIFKFSQLVIDLPKIKSIEINPLAVNKQGFVALDSKIILDKSQI